MLNFFSKKKEEKPPPEIIVRPFDPEKYEVVEQYNVNPFAKVIIARQKGNTGSFRYFVEEKPLDEKEETAKRRLVEIMGREIEPPDVEMENRAEYVISEAKRLTKKYRRSLGKFTDEAWEKIYYYVVRDLAGYGDLNTIMEDPHIEDISCNGLNKPIFIWHRKYESIPTNVEFNDEMAYNNFIVKLAHMSGKHISSAHPILDAMLPQKHRLAATFMKEVSTFGSTFCIRKFKPDPFSIIDLIHLGTLDETMAAYLWELLENKMSLMIIGGTGAGKTSMLNALMSMLSPYHKVVTVEEIAELNLPHENWVQLISRQGFIFGSSQTTSISLFDLVKLSLRYRPDYITVGEVRGEEAYVLFQAVATGHGGLCTMHADSLDHVVKRLTSPPMNVSEVYIPLMNLCIHIARVDLPKKRGELSFGRRVRSIMEIVDFEKYNPISEWDVRNDSFTTTLEKSVLLERIAERRGKQKEEIIKDVKKRRKYIRWMVKEGIRDQKEVAKAIMGYYQGQTTPSRKRKITEEVEVETPSIVA